MLLDSAWLPHCSMKRIVCHWTAGGHRASSLDKEHYHVMVEADGTVLGHGEVQVQLGIPQDGKWDPLVLPWEPSMGVSQVGTFFRTLVQASIDQGSVETEAPVLATVVLDGKKIGDARLLNGSCYAPVDAVARRVGVPVPAAAATTLVLDNGQEIPIQPVDDEPHVDVMEVATAMGLKPRWNSGERVLTLR